MLHVVSYKRHPTPKFESRHRSSCFSRFLDHKTRPWMERKTKPIGDHFRLSSSEKSRENDGVTLRDGRTEASSVEEARRCCTSRHLEARERRRIKVHVRVTCKLSEKYIMIHKNTNSFCKIRCFFNLLSQSLCSV